VDIAAGNRLAVKVLNAASNVWEPLGGNAGNLYLSTGSILQTNGSQLNTSNNHWLAFDSEDRPYVIFSEFSSGGNPFVKRFNGTGWEEVGSGAISTDRAAGVGITIDQSSNTLFVVYLSGAGTAPGLKVLSFSGTAWNVLPFPGDNINGDKNTSVTGTRHSAITLDHDNNPCIAYFNTANNNKATVIRYNRSSSKWELLGVLSGRDVNYINITRSLSGDLYAAFMDIMSLSANASVLRVFKLSAGSTTWTELVHAPAERGVDEPVQNISIAVSAANKEYLAYTKVNSSSVVTPIVR